MMYSALAGVYDRLAYDFDYAQWADRYISLLKRHGGDLHEIVDMGCGTGTLGIELSKRGYKITAMDLSGDMLSVASDKARKAGQRIAFSKQDMRHFAVPHLVDGIFCACDGVNYLTKDEGAISFFNCARAALKKGGALAFDVSGPEKLQGMARQQRFFEETDDCAYIWVNQMEGSILTLEISFYIKCDDGRYERFHETHRQRAWSAGELCDLLSQAGFTDISSETDAGRIYFSAKSE